MGNQLLLVGSIPLDTVEDVMRTFGAPLGPYLPAMPDDLRFQVSIPMINSVVRTLYFPEPGDIEKVRPGFEEALAAEIELIVRRIPASDLAIQWDLAGELLAVYGQSGNPPSEASIETHVAPVRRLSALLPTEAALGFHFCFGTFGGWPAFAPADLG